MGLMDGFITLPLFRWNKKSGWIPIRFFYCSHNSHNQPLPTLSFPPSHPYIKGERVVH